MDPQWLEWAKRLQAVAQNGLTFAQDPFDRERYQAVRRIAAEMMTTNTPVEADQVADFFARETGYATPKVDVRAAIFQDETILLVKEKSDGGWTLPGGWADICESPAENIVREVSEESGFKIRVVRLAAVYDRSKHPHVPPFPFHVYKFFFMAEIVGGSATPSPETEAVAFFKEGVLPPLSISRVTPAQIGHMFQHYRQPDLPTQFD